MMAINDYENEAIKLADLNLAEGECCILYVSNDKNTSNYTSYDSTNTMKCIGGSSTSYPTCKPAT